MAGVPLGFSRFRPWYAALRTGAAFNPLDLPGLKAYYDIRQLDTLFQDAAGTTPVTVATDPIGRWDAVGPSGAPNLTQATVMSRPPYQLTPTRAEFDLLDDSVSVMLPAISGGQIVIVSPAGIWIDSLNFAGGTFTIGPSGYTGGPDGLLSLLSGDVTAVYILDAPLSVDDQAAMVAFETARGSAGLITFGASITSDGAFSAVAIGTNQLIKSFSVPEQTGNQMFIISCSIETSTLVGGGGLRCGGFTSLDVFVPTVLINPDAGDKSVIATSKANGTRTEINLWLSSASTSGALSGEITSVREVILP